jgi:hypothetical protein
LAALLLGEGRRGEGGEEEGEGEGCEEGVHCGWGS